MTTILRQILVAVDVGGVLSQHDKGYTGAEHVNTAIDMPKALETLEALSKITIVDSTGKTVPKYKIMILSFCGYRRAVQTAESLRKYPEIFKDMYFVKDRNYKGYLCKHFGCDIMIDDRKDVLIEVRKCSPKTAQYHFAGYSGSKFTRVADWDEVLIMLENHTINDIVPDPTVKIDTYIYKV